MEKGITILIDGKMVFHIEPTIMNEFVEQLDNGTIKFNWKNLIETSKIDYQIKGGLQ